MIAVVIPALGRPGLIGPLCDNLRASTTVSVRPVIVYTPGEASVLGAAKIAGADWIQGSMLAPGDYARKVNLAYRITDDPWIFQGASDLVFREGWAEEALAVAETSGCGVIGTNDLGNPTVQRGAHSTHSLIARWYVEECGGVWGEPGVVLHEGYGHNWVDNELVETAWARGCFAFAERSHVEHLHPFWRKGRDDEVYERGRATYDADRALFLRRRSLWTGARVAGA